MRITPNLDNALLIEAKALAASKGIKLSELVEQGLRMRQQAEQPSQIKVEQPLPAPVRAARPSISKLFGIAPDFVSKAS